MFSPLLENIIKRENFAVINEENIDQFLEDSGDIVLLFTGDAKRRVEVDDVAVILPELVKAFKGRINAAVVERQSERPLQLRYRFNLFPTLVFLRNGEYLGVIKGVLDWVDYLNEISEILSRTPSEPPAFEFPDGCGIENVTGNGSIEYQNKGNGTNV